jgi:hypothetical protein
MKKVLVSTAFLCLLQVACKKDDSTPVKPPPTPTDQSFSTSFESMSELTQLGFEFKNLSDDTGDGWSIQSSTQFGGQSPYDGDKLLFDNYAASTGFSGIISDWLISPKLYFQNGDKISFYTLSNGSNDGYGDRLQLRLNTFNTSDSIAEPGTDGASSAVGNFTTPLIDVNALYKVSPPGDYPTTWTKYEATISGLNQPDSGRFALRYFVELNGGVNGDEIAVDKLEFTSANH